MGITEMEMLCKLPDSWIQGAISVKMGNLLARPMRKLTYFLPALAFYLLVFFLSSRDLGVQLDGEWLDKFPHALEFALLGFLLAFGFFHSLGASALTKVTLTFLTGLLLGFLDEFHQSFVPGRTADVRDIAADAAGVACGILIYTYLAKRSRRKTTTSPADSEKPSQPRF
jgi:VanZ family protein